MRFRVVLNTHKRPASAISVLNLLRTMASGNHEIFYTMAYDKEDRVTGRETDRGSILYGLVDEIDCHPRPENLLDIWNRNIPGKYNEDFYILTPDDAFCAAPMWDQFIVERAEEFGPLPPVMGWNDQANPSQLTVPIFSKRWLDLIESPVMAPIYPYWFADTAINELYGFATGNFVPCFQYLLMTSMPGKPNPIIRDVDLWWDVFAHTRQDRLREGRSIASKLGITVSEDRIREMLAGHAERDRSGRAETHKICAALDEAGRKPPSEWYLRCVENAKAILAE